MSTTSFNGGMTRYAFSAVIVMLLCASTSAFTGVRFNSYAIKLDAIHRNLYSSGMSGESSSIQFRSQLYSSPAVEMPVGDASSNSTSIAPTIAPKLGFLARLKAILSGKGFGKIQITKESMSTLGLNVLLAYGFVSNVSYITCLILAWVAFGKSTGLSPLVPGQWKKFLLVYAGFFAANNVLRPLRFSFSLTITPLFDKIIDIIEEKTKWSRRASTGVTIFLVNIFCTFFYLFAGLFLATTIAKVPLLP